jgi:LacI family transcriptional regulator
MKTIAEEAEVTLTTVSRVLNKTGGKYADETVEKIFAIAKRLKYRPNALVRGMQTGKTGTAGVMIPAGNHFYCQIIAGIHEAFVDHGTIMVCSWNAQSENRQKEQREREIIHQLIDRRVEGIILRPSSEEFERSYFEEIWERDIPLILVDRQMAKIETDFVGTDDQRGGRMAAEHLISLGHRRMLFLGSSHTVSTSRLREAGFREVLSESSDAYCRSVTLDGESSWDAMIERFKSADAPTAVFCYSDSVARRSAEVFREAVLSIPGDISLLGFGNVPTTDSDLALTTFDQYPRRIGDRVARLYLDRVNAAKPDEFRRELIQPDLVVRHSTRPVPGKQA